MRFAHMFTVERADGTLKLLSKFHPNLHEIRFAESTKEESNSIPLPIESNRDFKSPAFHRLLGDVFMSFHVKVFWNVKVIS